MFQNQWTHSISLQDYALETLQEEYCYQYAKIHGKYPLPSIMNRDTLISEISNMRVSAHSGWEPRLFVINFLTT
jgi:hypothetical protein